MHALSGWNRPVFICCSQKESKSLQFCGLNNKAKWSQQNVAKCFCKVRNHAQCFTLNTSGKYHCCFRIKDLNAVSNPKFFHVSIETWPFSKTFKVRDRDIGITRPETRPRHSKTYLETYHETETRLETSSSGLHPLSRTFTFTATPSKWLSWLQNSQRRKKKLVGLN